MSSGAGTIGIFWFYKDRLMALQTPVSEGERRGVKVDSPLAHSEEWPRVVREHKAANRILTILEYDEVPRGRVLYDMRARCFDIYLDRALLDSTRREFGPQPEVRDALLAAFCLQEERVVLRTDPHYDTCMWTDPSEEDDAW